MVRRSTQTNRRVTPKGTTSSPQSQISVNTETESFKPSPKWVPALMIIGILGGLAMIFVNYVVESEALSMPSNWYLLGGLGLILMGILASTRFS